MRDSTSRHTPEMTRESYADIYEFYYDYTNIYDYSFNLPSLYQHQLEIINRQFIVSLTIAAVCCLTILIIWAIV